MKKIIRNSIALIFGIGILYAISIFVLAKVSLKGKPLAFYTNDYYVWKGGDTYEKFKEVDSLYNRDLLIIGSSRAYRGYDPVNFKNAGYSTWNIGSHAQHISNTAVLIKNLDLKRAPKKILLDISKMAFTVDRLESSVDLITNTNYSGVKTDILLEEKDVRLLNVFSVSMLNQNLGSSYKNEDYIGGGFATKPDSLNEEWIMRIENLNEDKKNQVVVKDFKSLIEILKYCKEVNQEIVLVHAPISVFYSKKNQAIFMESILEIAKEFDTKLIDLQAVDGINSRDHFYDDSHLNAAGVKIFNAALIEKLGE